MVFSLTLCSIRKVNAEQKKIFYTKCTFFVLTGLTKTIVLVFIFIIKYVVAKFLLNEKHVHKAHVCKR